MSSTPANAGGFHTTYQADIEVVLDGGLALRVVDALALDLEQEVHATLQYLTRIVDADRVEPGDVIGTIEMTPETRLVQYDLDEQYAPTGGAR